MNNEVYETYLYNANVRKESWDNIVHNINEKLQAEMTKKKKT
jgi:hypothetical protein